MLFKDLGRICEFRVYGPGVSRGWGYVDGYYYRGLHKYLYYFGGPLLTILV